MTLSLSTFGDAILGRFYRLRVMTSVPYEAGGG